MVGAGKLGKGRWLIVSATEKDPTCYHAKAEVLSQDTDKIRVAVSFVVDDDVTENSSCISEDISLPPRRLRVKLARPLDGRSDGGPHKKPAAAVIDAESGDRFRVESLQGLRSTYATEILRAWRFKKDLISLSGSPSAAVVSTVPSLPRTFSKPTKIAIVAK